jgi:hypothetical protein
MTTNAKLFLSALGFIALVANPAVAKTHHAKVSRGQTEQVGPPVLGSEVPYTTYQPKFALPLDFNRYNGYQQDRQIVGLHD